jgi:hypothetical protein
MLAPVAGLTALSPGLGSPLAVVREIAAAPLPSGVASARRLFSVLGEVARVTGMSLFCHSILSRFSTNTWSAIS